jgi:hypothetical protein
MNTITDERPFTTQDLENLLTLGTGLCLSIYMPTRIAGQETRQNRIRMKNLLSEAADRLAEIGMRTPDAADLLEPVERSSPTALSGSGRMPGWPSSPARISSESTGCPYLSPNESWSGSGFTSSRCSRC